MMVDTLLMTLQPRSLITIKANRLKVSLIRADMVCSSKVKLLDGFYYLSWKHLFAFLRSFDINRWIMKKHLLLYVDHNT